MDIHNIRYSLRRRRLEEIFDFAFLVLHENFFVFFKYGAPLSAVCLVFNGCLLYILRRYEIAPVWLSWQHLGLLLLLLFEQTFFHCVYLFLNSHLLFEKKPVFRRVFSGFFGIAPVYFWRIVIVRTLQYTLLAPMLLPLFQGLVRNFFLGEAVVLERIRGQDIRRRLESLAGGITDRIFAFLVLDALLFFVFLSMGVYCWNYFLKMTGFSAFWILEGSFSLFSPITHFLFFVYCAYHSVVKFLFYIDTRSLLEGWDLELMLEKGVRETGK